MTNKKESGVMNLTRRGFMKASSAVGSAAALAGGIALPFKSKPVAAAVAESVDEKIVWSACTVNCGSRCPLRMHVQNGENQIRRNWTILVLTNTVITKFVLVYVVVSCRRVYNPDRLKYPMKRW